MDGNAIAGMVSGVTKTWAKKRKAEERASRPVKTYYYSDRVTLKDAAWVAMKSAYLHASNNGTLPANARQVMYAARGEILEMTGRDSLDSVYFTQTLLPDFINEHPELTKNWRIAYDARGSFREPHTDDDSVRLGTLEVDKHIADVACHEVADFSVTLGQSTVRYPTAGPSNRYGAVLFIEKEGFWPLFQSAKIAERYDIALMSTKGESVVAARKLIDRICGEQDIPLFVLHDFDVAGINICSVLGRDNRRYEWDYDVELIDLGLRLEDANEWGLESEPVNVRQSDRSQLRRNGATAAEINYLCSGQRVELNAFASNQLVEWLEGKLEQHGVKKVVPDDSTLEAAFRRATQASYVRSRIVDIESEADEFANNLSTPKDLSDQIAERLKVEPSRAWDQVLADIVEDQQ